MDTKKKKDILEIFVKLKFGIELNEEEKMDYSRLDDDIKKTINELIDSYSFLYDLEKMLEKMYIEKDISFEDKDRIEKDISVKKLKMTSLIENKKN